MNRCLFTLCAVLGLACGSTSRSDGGTGGGGGGAGGSGGGGGGGDDAGRVADVCGTICTKLDLCEASDGGSDCAAQCPTEVAPFRDEYTQALAVCIRDTACADQILTWNTCADGGLDLDGGVHSCSGGSTNVCLAQAGDSLPASILEPFYTAVCPHLVTCGTATDDAACRALLGGLSSEPALKAYPDGAISCTASCLQGKACTDLSSANLELALDDCAARNCGIHLNR